MIPLYDDQPTERQPILTIVIIAANVLVYALWQVPNRLAVTVATEGFIPAEFTHHEPGAVRHLLLSMFMHGGLMHLIGNMWFLWIFGKKVEDVCGHFRFLCFYILCGAVATIAYAVANPDSSIPLVGASGAISGVLGAYLLKSPGASIRSIIPMGIFTRILDIPAYLFLIFWVGMQIYLQTTARLSEQAGGVAYMAHIGGFVAGVILILIFQEGGQQREVRYGDNW